MEVADYDASIRIAITCRRAAITKRSVRLRESIQLHDHASRRAIRADALAVPRFIVVVIFLLTFAGCHSSADEGQREKEAPLRVDVVIFKIEALKPGILPR